MEFVPHNYQKYCIDKIVSTPATGLFLDMGLGKTVITLSAVRELKFNRFAVSKVLVVAPKKVAESTWSKEIDKWEHLKILSVSLILGSQTKRINAVNTPADIYVINRENIPWLVDYHRNQWPYDMVVIDEFSSFKNHKAKRFKSLSMIRPRIKRIVGLTGTPAPNGLLDLWAQVYLLDGGQRLGKFITHFREIYFEPDQRSRDRIYSYAPKEGADDKIKNLIEDICISMKAEDYLELPDITYNTIRVSLDKKAEKAYKQLERDMLLQIDDQTIDAGSAAVLTNKLLQLCNGAIYDENRNIIPIHNCKLETFIELVEGLNGNPALVFYNFQHDKERIKKVLSKMNLRVRDLKTPQDETDWNNREIDILLAHPASAAYGLNLQQGGNHVIWFGLNWSLELYQQANKRLHRQGQTEKVIVHHLAVAEGVDGDVLNALAGKETTQEQLLLALKVRIERAKKG
ncbi:MAG TPA: DEAD/DEAH box helicase [Firmicutes bacterium]|nr:DEAD/DEAH box helicase [Bacillota bacterium]